MQPPGNVLFDPDPYLFLSAFCRIDRGSNCLESKPESLNLRSAESKFLYFRNLLLREVMR